MSNTDFIIKKLEYYLENFENLSDEELKQATWFVLYKANEQINRSLETTQELLEQNEDFLKRYNDLVVTMAHYESFINDSRLTKRFELYCRGKEVI